MATYNKIQRWVKNNYGFVPKTCWIAQCKELYGLPVRRAPNRFRDDREVPCPEVNANTFMKHSATSACFLKLINRNTVLPEILNLRVSREADYIEWQFNLMISMSSFTWMLEYSLAPVKPRSVYRCLDDRISALF